METGYYDRYWKYEFKHNRGHFKMPPEWNEKNLRRILSFCSFYIKGRVLDVGCGDGFFAKELSKLPEVTEVKGVDISTIAVKKASENYPNLEFHISSIVKLPFADNYFDTITALEIVEHVLDIEKMFTELNRVVKKNGYVIVATSDYNFLKKVLIAAFCFDSYFYPTNPHIRFFTKRTLSMIFKQFGFLPCRHKWNGGYFLIMPKGQMMIGQKIKERVK